MNGFTLYPAGWLVLRGVENTMSIRLHFLIGAFRSAPGIKSALVNCFCLFLKFIFWALSDKNACQYAQSWFRCSSRLCKVCYEIRFIDRNSTNFLILPTSHPQVNKSLGCSYKQVDPSDINSWLFLIEASECVLREEKQAKINWLLR